VGRYLAFHPKRLLVLRNHIHKNFLLRCFVVQNSELFVSDLPIIKRTCMCVYIYITSAKLWWVTPSKILTFWNLSHYYDNIFTSSVFAIIMKWWNQEVYKKPSYAFISVFFPFLSRAQHTKYTSLKVKLPEQAWTSPEGYRRLRLPDFLENRHMRVVRLSALSTDRLYSLRSYSR
jgi:hypothetical protein